jgi:hypothetical protein
MKVTRRNLLSIAGMGGVSFAFPKLAMSAASQLELENDEYNGVDNLIIFDSRDLPLNQLTESLDPKNLLDINTEAVFLWKNITAIKKNQYSKVVGITKWSDFVLIRSGLHDQGLRLIEPEKILTAKNENNISLFQWVMV